MTLRFQTADGQIVEADPYVMRRANAISDLIANNGGKIPEVIPLDKINSDELKIIIQYYTHYKDRTDEEENGTMESRQLPDFDKQFVAEHLNDMLEVTTACLALEAKALLDACTKYIASMATGRTAEEMVHIWGIPAGSDNDEDDEDEK